MGFHGRGCADRNRYEYCVLEHETEKWKNRQAENGLIASRRHYTRIHIETQTAARRQKKKPRAAERFSLTRGVAVRFRAAASLYLIVQSNSLQKTPLTNPVSVSEF